MVSSAIGIFVSLGIAAVFIFAIQQFTFLIEKNEAEENHLWASYYTRLYLGQAVRVLSVNGPQPNPPAQGYLRSDFDARIHVPVNTVVPFAIFERENGITSSEFRATGIFIKGANPNAADTYDRSFAVIFDLGCNVNPCDMTPDRNDLFFDRISRFQVVNFETEGANLKSVFIRLATRHFNSTNRQSWCFHTEGAAGCTSSYKDISSDMQITLRNNSLSTNSLTGGVTGRDERAHGGLYYYFPFLPRPSL
jgi:hypothetical protein